MKKLLRSLLLCAACVFALCGCFEKKEVKPAAPPKTPLVLESMPSGAAITIGTKDLGKTPKKFHAARKHYMVKLTLPGYEPEYFEFTAAGDEEQHVKATLKPLKGSVLISSVPAGAQIVMDGKVLGNTPFVKGGMVCGDYTVQIRKSGFAERSASWSIRDARPVKVSINLESNVGSLVLKSTPANANVYLNDRIVGVTPYQSEVEEGSYKLKLELPDHIAYEGTLSVARDKTSELTHKFRKLPGGIAVESKPAGAIVYLDEREVGKTPLTLKNLVADRSYQVRVVKDKFGEETREVKVSPGVVSSVNVDMSINAGGIDLVVGPPGVTVYLDNEKLQVAEVDPKGSELLAKVIELRDLVPGKHTVTIAHKRGLPDRKTVEINVLRGEVVRPDNITLWIPNAEIYYTNGQRSIGILYGVDPVRGPWFEDVNSRGARGYINPKMIREIKKLNINE